MSDRRCAICGADLSGRRRNAVYCGPPCRTEASAFSGSRGLGADGYRGPVAARLEASRKRTRRLWGGAS
jgi:hypothetical protein